MSLNILGLVFNLVGSLILVGSSFLVPTHQKNYAEKWTKRYWWQGWRPIFKISPPNDKPYWKIKWTRVVVRYGAIPPQHQWVILGLLFTLIGFALQLISL